MQYIKDRTEGFENYFPCRKKNVNSSMLDNGNSICRLLQQNNNILTLEPF